METVIVEIAQNLGKNYPVLSLVFFFVSQALQILFPPYPGDMVLIIEGYISSFSSINIVIIIINAVTATFLSSILLFKLGEIEKEKVLHSKFVKYFFDVKKVNKLRKLFNRFGSFVIFISKFIPGIFSIAVLCAGIFEVKKRSAYLSILLITTVHHVTLIVLGKVLGDNWTVVFEKINTYNRYIFIVVILIFIGYSVLHIIKEKLFHN